MLLYNISIALYARLVALVGRWNEKARLWHQGRKDIFERMQQSIKPEDKEATVFIQDIYQGEGLPGVPVGTVKKLRVFAYEYTYIKSASDHVAQGIQSGWDIKRHLGDVDVESDASVIFKIPANTPVSF